MHATNITSQTNFIIPADKTWTLSTTYPIALDTTDDTIDFVVTHKRNKFLPSGYVPPAYYGATNIWNYSYFEAGQSGLTQVYQTTNTFRKGDWVAFCLNVGRVSDAMLDVQALQLQQLTKAARRTTFPIFTWARLRTSWACRISIISTSSMRSITASTRFSPLPRIDMDSA